MMSLSALLRRTPAPRPASGPDPEATVRLAYRTVLRREPDRKGLARYVQSLHDGKGLPWLIEVMAQSDEFRAIGIPPPPSPRLGVQPIQALTEAPPLRVDATCTPAELQRLWDHVAGTWSGLGVADAHWSVPADDRYRAGVLAEQELAAFYKSGADEVARMNAWLARAGIPPAPDAICAELGCGVGRITGSLARQYHRVLAFGISPPHIQAATARMAVEARGNVEFVHVDGPAALDALHDIDVFFSIIALQHSPPPIILDVLARAFAALRPGGYAFFHVPTYALDYRYAVATHLDEIARGERPDMEVHFVPQRDILALAHHAGLAVAEIQPDECIGNHERWISNTVLLVRPGSP